MGLDEFTTERHSMTFAMDETVAATFSESLTHAIGDFWPIEVVRGGGDALRRIYRSSLQQVFVCVEHPNVDAPIELIEIIGQRRPELPRLALALSHDDAIERLARSAGATHYFAIHHATDVKALRQTIELARAAAALLTTGDLPPPTPTRTARPRAARSALSGLGRQRNGLNELSNQDLRKRERT